MKDMHSQEQIDAMRKRLYERGSVSGKTIKHKLTETKVDVSRDWTGVEPAPETTDLRGGMAADIDAETGEEVVVKKTKRHYRSFVLIGSLLIFVIVAGLSSLFLYFGGNQISNDNIIVAVTGPFSVGGGEVLPLQIGVTNQNSVPIGSATLIIKYPQGTRSAGDSPRDLFEERIALGSIEPGEVQNIPIRVAVFGEENAEKLIEATIEYRIDGSNGMFYKDAEPLAFRISSSPLVIRVETIEKVASGQLIDITLTAVSNASSPLYDVLISASYPNGFAYETSDPEPVFGENVWRIDELLPEGAVTIKLTGIVSGLTEETFRINFAGGQAETDNPYIVGALLAEAKADFVIERPFIDVDIKIDNNADRVAVIDEGEKSLVEIEITNTLDETVYDMVVEVIPGGNALNETSIRSGQGFYDSNFETVRWEVANNSSFAQIFPGDSRTLKFDVVPGANRTTSSFDLVVNVYARRVAESSALETLIGTTRAEAKYSSHITLGSQVGRSPSSFVDSGPVPPKVGETTTYTLTLVAEAGANDMVNTVVETSLPLYVNWLDEYNVDGSLTYNSVSKKMQWVIGNIPTGERRELNFQVNILPSTSQLRLTPVLLNKQTVRANDRFSGALLQDQASPVTTELSTEMGFEEDNGKVGR